MAAIGQNDSPRRVLDRDQRRCVVKHRLQPGLAFPQGLFRGAAFQLHGDARGKHFQQQVHPSLVVNWRTVRDHHQTQLVEVHAVLNQRLENSEATYYFLNRIIEEYPHNRETYMKLAEALSRDGRWAEVIPHLERSLFYTRGDEAKIAEVIGWLGTAYLRIGDDERAIDLLEEVTQTYSDQIGLTFRAYGNLIRHARESGNDRQLDGYVDDVQDYAESLIRSGKDNEYPLLRQRMSQILTIAGYEAEAKEWAAGPSQ